MHAQPHTASLPRVILLSCVAALGGFLFGYDSGVINGTVAALREAFDAGNVGSGFNVASMLLGSAGGAFLAGRIADRMGRRAALFLAAVLFGFSAYGSGIVDSSAPFVFYRIVGGFAVGMASIISPAYISEIAPASCRGALATLQQMAIVLGLFFAFVANYLIAGAAGGPSETLAFGIDAWRWMFWAELIPVILFFAGLFFVPESPRYLVAAGKPEKARAVLARLSHPDDADRKVTEIRETLREGRRPSWRDLVRKTTGRVHPIVWVGLGIAALQQLVGINIVFYYGEVLWRSAGFSQDNALLINVVSGVVNIGSTIGALLLVDRWGRKPLLLYGAIGMAVFLAVLALVFGNADRDPSGDLALTRTAGITALLAAHAYIVCFGLSWGPIMWVLLGEMFPNRLRGAALSLAGVSQWMTNFAVTMTFPILLGGIGLGGAYAIYASFAVVAAFFAWRFVAETKGKTLEAMQ